MKILVTGASGFIGSRLADTLADQGHQVFALQHDTKIENCKIKSILGDITNPALTIPEEKFDIIYHLAAITPMEKNKKIIKKVNYDGTINFFNHIKDKTNFLVYASGLGVFGDTGGSIIDEKTPLKPHTSYAKVRLDAQKFLEDNCKKYSINFIVTYFGEVYGDGGWFTSQILNRLKKGSFKMPKGGEYYRCLVHVDDVVNALIAISGKNTSNEAYIITDSNPILFKEFINFVCDRINVKHPGSIPSFLAKAVLGGDFIKLLTTSVKASNEKISKFYNFKFPDYKEGIKSFI